MFRSELDTEAWVSLSFGRSVVGGQWSVKNNIPVGEHLKSIFYFNRKISVIVGWCCCWWLLGSEIDEWRLCEFCTLVPFSSSLSGRGWILSCREMNSCLSKVLRKFSVGKGFRMMKNDRVPNRSLMNTIKMLIIIKWFSLWRTGTRPLPLFRTIPHYHLCAVYSLMVHKFRAKDCLSICVENWSHLARISKAPANDT